MSNLKQIYIHIGPPKTGTTTIQSGLNSNQSALLSNGYLIPKKGRIDPRFAGHHNLGWELGRRELYTRSLGNWVDLAEEINHSPVSNVIISSESFSHLDISSIREIQKILAPHQIRMVMYVRRQDQLLQSRWQQRIKAHLQPPPPVFRDFLFEHKDREYPKSAFAIIGDWETVLGPDNLILRVLEKESMQGHLFHDFLTSCGIFNPDSFKRPQNFNESLGARTLEVLFDIKKNLMGRIDQPSLRMVLNIVNRYANQENWNRTRLNMISREIHDEIMEWYGPSNTLIARKFFGREKLFLQPFLETETILFNEKGLTLDVLSGLFRLFPFSLYSSTKSKKMAYQYRDEGERYSALRDEFFRICTSDSWRRITRLNAVLKKLKLGT